MKYFLVAWGLMLPLNGLAAEPAKIKEFSLTDAAGKKHGMDEWQGKKAVVLFFLGVECPVSNFYAPEYARVAKTFADKGVAFYGIHPDPDVTAALAAKHAAEYRLPFPILLDPTQAVTRQAGVAVVPCAVVLSPDGVVRYRGRMDDRYSADGVRREKPTRRDLEKALEAVLAGKALAVVETKAFGCPLPQPVKPK